MNFNDKTLYSDNINEDEIYKLITGFNKKEYLEFVEQEEKNERQIQEIIRKKLALLNTKFNGAFFMFVKKIHLIYR